MYSSFQKIILWPVALVFTLVAHGYLFYFSFLGAYALDVGEYHKLAQLMVLFVLSAIVLILLFDHHSPIFKGDGFLGGIFSALIVTCSAGIFGGHAVKSFEVGVLSEDFLLGGLGFLSFLAFVSFVFFVPVGVIAVFARCFGNCECFNAWKRRATHFF